MKVDMNTAGFVTSVINPEYFLRVRLTESRNYRTAKKIPYDQTLMPDLQEQLNGRDGEIVILDRVSTTIECYNGPQKKQTPAPILAIQQRQIFSGLITAPYTTREDLLDGGTIVKPQEFLTSGYKRVAGEIIVEKQFELPDYIYDGLPNKKILSQIKQIKGNILIRPEDLTDLAVDIPQARKNPITIQTDSLDIIIGTDDSMRYLMDKFGRDWNLVYSKIHPKVDNW